MIRAGVPMPMAYRTRLKFGVTGRPVGGAMIAKESIVASKRWRLQFAEARPTAPPPFATWARALANQGAEEQKADDAVAVEERYGS